MTPLLLALLSLPSFAAPAASPLPQAALRPPVAPPQARRFELFGRRFIDEFYWMRDIKDPRVLRHLEAEDRYAESMTAHTEGLRETLFREMLSRIKEDDESASHRRGDWEYFSRSYAGKQYRAHFRRRGGEEQKLLDLNELAQGEDYMALEAFEPSDDGRLLAYSLDKTGFRQYELRVKDLRTGEHFLERIPRTGSVAWAADNETLFYTVEDSAKRQYRVYRHRVGEPVERDALVYEEKDERFAVEIKRSRSGRLLFLGSASQTASEYRFLDASTPEGSWTLIAPRRAEHEYYPDHRGGSLYVLTNDGGRNFRVAVAPLESPSRWSPLVPHRPEAMIEQLLAFEGHCALFTREGGLPQIEVLDDCRWEKRRRLSHPEPSYEAAPGPNHVFASRTLRYVYESPLTPDTDYEHDMAAGTTRALKRKEVPGFDASRYLVERAHATAPDGVKVPITILARKGTPRDGTAGIYLTGYGAYGIPWTLDFDAKVFSMVDRGAIYAIAHIRGGGEFGQPWHDEGRMLKKKNSFTDFIAAAEQLLAERRGAKDKLVIEGGSAGGLLMGAATNMRPELFKAVVSHVPFVDVINSMLDESIPLTVTEFEEWGNPKVRAEHEYMLSYSPYDNLSRRDYPAMLVKTGVHDSQVMYWEPMKYVAKLRKLKTDSNPLLFKVNMKAGHGGSSGRYDALREQAFDYAFMLDQMGLAGR